jgi:hypothetical protein
MPLAPSGLKSLGAGGLVNRISAAPVHAGLDLVSLGHQRIAQATSALAGFGVCRADGVLGDR